MSCVLADARDLPVLRVAITGLLRPRQRRLHFHDESAARRQVLLAAFAELPTRSLVVIARMSHGRDEEGCREGCIRHLVGELQDRRVDRLVLESRHDDRVDMRTIIRTRRPTPALVFEHRSPIGEPLLWAADGVAWAGGMGGEHLALLGTNVEVMQIRP